MIESLIGDEIEIERTGAVRRSSKAFSLAALRRFPLQYVSAFPARLVGRTSPGRERFRKSAFHNPFVNDGNRLAIAARQFVSAKGIVEDH
jgi:hypothetical protein